MTDRIDMFQPQPANLTARIASLVRAKASNQRPLMGRADLYRSLLTTLLVATFFLVAGSARADDDDNTYELDRPRRVRATLHDGQIFIDVITSWSFDALIGEQGSQPWLTLRDVDIWKIHQAFMDTDEPLHWINLGRLMLMQNESTKAERAFNRALRLDDLASPPLIQQTRDAVQAIKEEAARKAREAEAARLYVGTPEARPRPLQRWQPLDDAAQTKATVALRAMVQNDLPGESAPTVQTTSYLLVASDLPEEQTEAAVRTLEASYQMLADLFDETTQPGAPVNIFHGRAVVRLVQSRDRFALLEAQRFHFSLDDDVLVRCHCEGPDVIIIACPGEDSHAFQRALSHALTHGFMHRLSTSRMLPLWANEGLAWLVPQLVLRHDGIDSNARRQARQALSQTRGVAPVLNMAYDTDMSMQDVDEAGHIGALLIEHLWRHQPDALVSWVLAAKSGRDPQELLKALTGKTYSSLTDEAAAWYRVNE